MQVLHAAARAAAARLRLKRHAWRGPAGNWAGAGRGSSLDFQDHRPYLPGDDPRHINWQAYARTGALSLKLYREEVSPTVDLVLDTSASMTFDKAKLDRALELALFALESALALGASLRLFAACGAEVRSLAELDLVNGALERMPVTSVSGLSLESLPFRHGSLRVIVSDCLLAGSPSALLRTLVSGRGRPIVLAPRSARESEPDWEGHLELIDCETGERVLRHVDAAFIDRYRQAYRRHFEIWRDESRRQGIVFAQVPCEGELVSALQVQALAEGAVELAS